MRRRRKVYNTAGDAHSLTFTTYRRTNVFTDAAACERFLEVLDRERKKLDWEVWAYVLMPDHVHVLGWPRTFPYDVSEFLRLVKQPVSSRLLSQLRFQDDCRLTRLWNKATGKHRLWQAGGGHDRNLVGRGQVGDVIDYIHNNPVVAGLTNLPWEHRWSSAAWYQGHRDVPFEVDTWTG